VPRSGRRSRPLTPPRTATRWWKGSRGAPPSSSRAVGGGAVRRAARLSAFRAGGGVRGGAATSQSSVASCRPPERSAVHRRGVGGRPTLLSSPALSRPLGQARPGRGAGGGLGAEGGWGEQSGAPRACLLLGRAAVCEVAQPLRRTGGGKVRSARTSRVGGPSGGSEPRESTPASTRGSRSGGALVWICKGFREAPSSRPKFT